MLQAHNHLHGPSLDLLQPVYVSFTLGSPGLDPALQVCLTRMGRGEGSPPSPGWQGCAWCSPGGCWPFWPPGHTAASCSAWSTCSALFYQAAFQLVRPPEQYMGVTPPRMQDFAFPSAELHEIPVCPFLQPVKVSLNWAQLGVLSTNPPSMESPANKLRLHSVPSPRSFRMLNSARPSIRLWGIPPRADLQLNLVVPIPIP